MPRSPLIRRTAAGIAAALTVGLAVTAPAFADGSGAAATAATASAVAAGAQAEAGHPTVHVNRPGVRIRQEPRTGAVVLATAAEGLPLWDWCQTDRGTTPVTDGTARISAWWSMVTLTGGSDLGWVSNLRLDGGGTGPLPGVPECRG